MRSLSCGTRELSFDVRETFRRLQTLSDDNNDDVVVAKSRNPNVISCFRWMSLLIAFLQSTAHRRASFEANRWLADAQHVKKVYVAHWLALEYIRFGLNLHTLCPESNRIAKYLQLKTK